MLKSITLGLLIPTFGCGVVQDSEQSRVIDGAKLIAVNNDNPDDETTYEQASYSIDSTHRLLMRYESLLESSKNVRTDENRKVLLQITPSRGSVASLQQSLKICPLTRNWMMAATWKRAHPFNQAGRWHADGGDFLRADCIISASEDKGKAVFDVTPWFLSYVRGRNQNYGLIAISDEALVEIAGDNAGTSAPQLSWTETHISDGSENSSYKPNTTRP